MMAFEEQMRSKRKERLEGEHARSVEKEIRLA